MDIKCISDDKYGSLSLYDDRGLVLVKLNEAIAYLHKKGIKGKYQNKENEKLRIQYLKALAYTCNVYSSIKKDIDIEDLSRKYEEMTLEIKSLKEGGGYYEE